MALRKFFTDGRRISLTRRTPWVDVSPYFKKEEIFSPDTLHLLSPLNLDAIKKLNQMREFLGAAILVNHGENRLRGVRSIREQQKLVETHGAAWNSMHVAGMAFDVSSPKVEQQIILEAAIAFSWTTIILYDTFTHLDIRNTWALGGQTIGAVVRPLIIDNRTSKTKGRYEVSPYIEMAKTTAPKRGLSTGDESAPESPQGGDEHAPEPSSPGGTASAVPHQETSGATGDGPQGDHGLIREDEGTS